LGKKAPYEAVYKAKKGLISCYYLTSYQGKWYSHSLSEVWSTYSTAKERQHPTWPCREMYSTAKEPGTFYGTGVYKSK